MTQKPMTKTEANEYLSRISTACAQARRALKAGQELSLLVAVQEIGGCAGEIEVALDSYSMEVEPRGIRGVS